MASCESILIRMFGGWVTGDRKAELQTMSTNTWKIPLLLLLLILTHFFITRITAVKVISMSPGVFVGHSGGAGGMAHILG